MNENRAKQNDVEIDIRWKLANLIALEAGRLTLEYFQRDDLIVDRKADNSPVTAADREAEQLLRRRISEAFPDDGIVGEEFGETAGVSSYQWILDPIDGTKSFISGVPLYGTMVAVERVGSALSEHGSQEANFEESGPEEAVIGVVYFPALDESISAARGRGAWSRQGQSEAKRAHVAASSRLADGLFVTSQIDSFAKRGAEEAFSALQNAASITRTWGDCYGYLLVATGRAAAMVDPELNVWDAAAVQPIIEEAGGRFGDWRGRRRIDSGDAIGACPGVFEEVLAITRSHEPLA